MSQGGGNEWVLVLQLTLIGLILFSNKVVPLSSFAFSVSSPMGLNGLIGGSGILQMATGGDSCSANHFDYLVIGGGSGGVASARRAATYGAKVGLIENQVRMMSMKN